jgi:hypothetical protein
MGSAQTMFERRTRGRSAAGTPCCCQAFWARSQRESPAICDGAGVDVDAVDVVLDDEAGDVFEELVL